jgi:hypothetical protein
LFGIYLLTEKETTAILKKLNLLTERLGFDQGDQESRELAKDTLIESIARDLRLKGKRAGNGNRGTKPLALFTPQP